MAVTLSALSSGHAILLRKYCVLILVRGWVNPRAIARLEWVVDKLKKKKFHLDFMPLLKVQFEQNQCLATSVFSFRNNWYNDISYTCKKIVFIYLFIIALKPFVRLWPFIPFLILYKVGRTLWLMIKKNFCLHTGQYKHIINTQRQLCLAWDLNSRSPCLCRKNKFIS
jgi:hypothetical protein